ncbi:MAG: hypothetical protein KKC30_10160 [Proteobacteria bacterium]|nr:hypothetical protein [Pseudomonadota bacterium]MBU4277093.1 hypothetical protein [Pseudomonadota bacterium]MBU4383526.1 hypothetical protein [Pseudomonadota bacterium]MBU4604306.1 hypothetical protein [Pseudomonadota bacterium]MCG2764451.1 hypothetical protein [Desulfarculaceae bacterium]
MAPKNTPSQLPVEKAVFWTSADKKVKAFIYPAAKDGGFTLLTVGGNGLKVIYRTEINSSQEVVRELKPAAGTNEFVQIYKFKHQFSRTTIWMSLDFLRGDRPVNGLGRLFYGGIPSTSVKGSKAK